MTEKRKYKPVGGISRVELFAVQGLSGVEDMVQGQGIAVALMDDGSHYDESIEANSLPVSVKHTLTLCSSRDNAQEWFDADFLSHAAVEGVVAHITLLSGEDLMVGWSERFGFEQALRLRSLVFHSGLKPNDSPRVELTLHSRDVRSALKE